MPLTIDTYKKEFSLLEEFIHMSKNILLFAHNNPDPDSLGSVFSLCEIFQAKKKNVTISCFDKLPDYTRSVFKNDFTHPKQLQFSSFDLIIACDSVERGYDSLHKSFDSKKQKIVLLDHHGKTSLKNSHVSITDTRYSSTCELLHDFFIYTHERLVSPVPTMLLLGILSDTGHLQHPNTNPKVLTTISNLLVQGASLSKISEILTKNNQIFALHIWGKALKKARFNKNTGVVCTALTKEDLQSYPAISDKISQIAVMLSAAKDVRYALVLSQKNSKTIRGSLRASKNFSVDVSEVAQLFGGGGHALASGFEIKGRIQETPTGWYIL